MHYWSNNTSCTQRSFAWGKEHHILATLYSHTKREFKERVATKDMNFKVINKKHL